MTFRQGLTRSGDPAQTTLQQSLLIILAPSRAVIPGGDAHCFHCCRRRQSSPQLKTPTATTVSIQEHPFRVFIRLIIPFARDLKVVFFEAIYLYKIIPYFQNLFKKHPSNSHSFGLGLGAACLNFPFSILPSTNND